MQLFNISSSLIHKIKRFIAPFFLLTFFCVYSSPTFAQLKNAVSQPYPAPEITDISAWINSKPLTLQSLRGKVILVDFWTYSCINCIRTLPYLKTWYQKYHSQGLEIIGIHSPEFEFEKVLANVQHAVTNKGIQYPVALDNNFSTWRAYNNQYWPAHFLIDKNGKVVYEHFGEGEYDVTENNIRYLLGMKAITPASITPVSTTRTTPETYLGFQRAENFANPGLFSQNRSYGYVYPATLALNQWALAGNWQVNSQFIESKNADAKLKIYFKASKVFAVMGSATGQPINVNILLNGKLIKTISVNQNQLYELISLNNPQENILEIISTTPGLTVYTFTFG